MGSDWGGSILGGEGESDALYQAEAEGRRDAKERARHRQRFWSQVREREREPMGAGE
jgi:hypothetical protein